LLFTLTIFFIFDLLNLRDLSHTPNCDNSQFEDRFEVFTNIKN